MTPPAGYARLVILKPFIVQKKPGKVKNKMEHTPTYTSLYTPIGNWYLLRLGKNLITRMGTITKKTTKSLSIFPV